MDLGDDLKATIRTVPDFPIDGIQFRDITPVLSDPVLMGKWQEPSPIMYGIAVFMLMFYLGPGDTSTFGWLFDTIGI